VFDLSIRNCSACPLRKGCKAPVPGEGNEDASVVLIGEAPGSQEDQYGRPFIGQAGEFLDALLRVLKLSRGQVYISNVLKCRPFNNNTPSPLQAKICADRWLTKEIARVKPKIIVTLGWPATHYITKSYDTMEHLHGAPIEMGDTIVLPAYHPAAGFHDTSLLRHVYDDFGVLGKLLEGHSVESLLIRDEYPEPDYKVVSTTKEVKELLSEPRYALDTEQTSDGKMWSIQVSLKAGEAYFIPRELLPEVGRDGRIALPEKSEVIVHSYLHEAQYINIPNFIDSMLAAYLLGLPQGLKALASRLCGMHMISYPEMVRPYRRAKTVRYLQEAAGMEWANPPIVPTLEWNEKRGEPFIRDKKPQHIKHKINARLKKSIEDRNYDPYSDWFSNVSPEERVEVESVLGVMPDADLSDIPFDDATLYANRDPDATMRVWDKMAPMIQEQKLGYILRCVDQSILPMVRYMMDRGTVVDTEYLKELSAEYLEKMVVANRQCIEIIGHPFNPKSDQQVGKVLYDELRFKPTAHTETGRPQVNAQELGKVEVDEEDDDGEIRKIQHPVIEPILDYRRAQKLKSTYSDALVELAIPDDAGEMRVHTELLVTRTETGRLASKRPNLQNQPIRTDDGKKIRKAFTAPQGSILVAPDYSQQEMRLMAHVSQCQNLLKIYRNNEDVHSEMAMKIFGINAEEAKEYKYRRPAKDVNFGVIYLISAAGLYEYLLEDGIEGWTIKDCEDVLKEWYKTNHEVRDWQQETIAFATRNGYVVDMFGRRRWIPEMACPIRKVKAAGGRQAVNMPIQGGCATITKLGMKAVWDGLDIWDGDLRPILQIHDEILLELSKPDRLQDVAVWLKEKMEGVVELSVPVVVEVKAGERWGDMKELALS